MSTLSVFLPQCSASHPYGPLWVPVKEREHQKTTEVMSQEYRLASEIFSQRRADQVIGSELT